MKKTALILFAFVAMAGMANAQSPMASAQTHERAKEADGAAFSWDRTTSQLGKIAQGKPVTVSFEFKNSGNKPLIISSVNSSCGCTVPDYSKESVLPGKKGFVKLTYNAASAGSFNKSVTVLSNAAPGTLTLSISGEVVPEAGQ